MTKSFVADQIAHSSGVYKAIHTNDHTPPHHVLALNGDTFPR
jgi:hypothetical protein